MAGFLATAFFGAAFLTVFFTTFFTDFSIQPGQRYVYEVSAVNPQGEGRKSAPEQIN